MKKAWFITLIAIITGVIFSIGFFKVPPTLVLIMEDMNVGLTTAGLLMSMIGVSSTLLALPGGAIMQKVGPRNMGLLAIAFAVAGNVGGALAPDMSVLLISRLIEGVGFGMIGLVVPAVIAAWFPAEKRGLPMAVWTLWISGGMLIIFNVTNLITPVLGWRGVWWFSTILFVMAGIMFSVVVKIPRRAENSPAHQPVKAAEKVSFWDGFKAPRAWMLAVMFTAYGFGSGAFCGYYPAFLVQSLGMEPGTANAYSSLATLGMMVGGMAMGILLNRIRNRYHEILLITCWIISGIFFYFQFKLTFVGLILPFMLLMGIILQTIPPIIFTMAPDTATRAETVATVMGIVSLGQNLGGLLSTAIVGAAVERSGRSWDGATAPLMAAVAVGCLAAVFLQILTRRKTEKMKRVCPYSDKGPGPCPSIKSGKSGEFVEPSN